MVPWLVPIAIFPILAATYLGGAAIHIEGGGKRQLLGLLIHYAAFLGVYALLRTLLSGPVGPVLGGVIVPLISVVILLPFLAKLAFKLVGVSITAAA